MSRRRDAQVIPKIKFALSTEILEQLVPARQGIYNQPGKSFGEEEAATLYTTQKWEEF